METKHPVENKFQLTWTHENVYRFI